MRYEKLSYFPCESIIVDGRLAVKQYRMTGMKDSNPWKVLMAAYSVNADAGTSTFMLTSVQHCVTDTCSCWLST
ncbi:hypothetical protein MAR_033873 [Mya arenaria]|uniref:Uncharacterized protein n=1 Tax=Mya arenaria TaxID=6604 RepID=A0ABY7GJ51_MYAAR|nr:hypothetical protein MAR_033873 [Mya arenaria]